MPLTSDGDDWCLKVLIDNENVFTRIDVWATCHECPPSWVRCLSPKSVERRTTSGSTTITKTRLFINLQDILELLGCPRDGSLRTLSMPLVLALLVDAGCCAGITAFCGKTVGDVGVLELEEPVDGPGTTSGT